MAQNRRWSRLDNAAKIFPPTTSERFTNVFRFVCELTESVDGELLQRALERTVEKFPLYHSVLKKGLFWYYFEESDLIPRVAEECLPVCASIYDADKSGLLFRVSYYKRRINLEIFHALADGTGALKFLRGMVLAYLAEKHGIAGEVADLEVARDSGNPDAFFMYYDKTKKIPASNKRRAYRIRGEKLPDNRLGVIEGFLSVKSALEKAHEHDATLSEFLIALLLCSIRDGMAVRERSRPAVITVPVDLRRFFPIHTTRNFFGVIRVAHDFRKDGREYDEVLANVRQSFARQLTEENLHGIIGRYSAIENNPFVKAIPLSVKIPILRMAGRWADGEDTAAFSNVGKVSMPPEAAKRIKLFNVFPGTSRPQVCLCAFEDTLAISVSSPLRDTGLQRRFFRGLTGMGIPVRVISNLERIEGGDANHVAL
ncbi:MAG: hypothetical protein LBP30_02605 [Clostridiales Family XIII bacterium]|jgi:hypothetical protein|nr:hypothetical protein [Clostridiales Family XIII bacterium]